MKYVDAHLHILPFSYIPDSFGKTVFPFIDEWMIRADGSMPLLFLAGKLVPGKKFSQLHEAVSVFKMDEHRGAQVLLKEMDKAGVEVAFPLMMDLSQSSFGDTPEISYQYQIKLISQVASSSGGRLRPFVMLDPRRNNSFKLIRKALEDYCFYGVKIYTELGYHPDPDSLYNIALGDHVKENLADTFEYCELNNVPVIAHCSEGGAYSGKLRESKGERLDLVRPESWRSVLLKYPELKLNLAHMGGMWWDELCGMMDEFKNLYTDTAYCDHLFKDPSSMLNIPEYAKKRIMFASDWPMNRHTWDVKQWVEAFTKAIDVDWQEDLMRNNALAFVNRST